VAERGYTGEKVGREKKRMNLFNTFRLIKDQGVKQTGVLFWFGESWERSFVIKKVGWGWFKGGAPGGFDGFCIGKGEVWSTTGGEGGRSFWGENSRGAGSVTWKVDTEQEPFSAGVRKFLKKPKWGKSR